MKIGYFSDLHVEFMKPDALQAKQINSRDMGRETFAKKLGESYTDADVIVAAGDIGVGVDAVRFLKLAFPDKSVIHIPGNHEHYARELHKNHVEMAAEAEGSNIHFFHDGGTIEIEEVIFCAATLWTDYALLEPKVSIRHAMMEVSDLMTDFKKIKIKHRHRVGLASADYPKKIRPLDVLELHVQHKKNIQQAIQSANESGKRLVVVSHHAPCAQSLLYGATWTGDYVYAPTDVAYASHLNDLMEGEDAPLLWIHGHTHIAVDYTVGQTRVLSNPKGYGAGEDTGWEWGKNILLE